MPKLKETLLFPRFAFYKRVGIFFVIFLVCLLGGGSVAQTSPMPDDATLKAVFIERFTRFVEWPDASLDTVSDSEFFICALGDDNFSRTVAKVYVNKKILDRRVVVKTVRVSQISECHVLYLPTLGQTQLFDVLSRVKTRPVLTISDTQGYAQRGVQINFFYVNDQLRFEINEAAMRKANFQVSYKLLSYAVIVEPFEDETF